MKFAGAYQQRWTSNFKSSAALSVALATWREQLDGFTPDVISNAFNRTMKMEKYRDWPPTASDFRELCKMEVKAPVLPRLPYKRSDEDKAKGKKWIQQWRRQFPDIFGRQ